MIPSHPLPRRCQALRGDERGRGGGVTEMNKPGDPGGLLHAAARGYLFLPSGIWEVLIVGSKAGPVLGSQGPGSTRARLAAALRSWRQSEAPWAAREEADVF